MKKLQIQTIVTKDVTHVQMGTVSFIYFSEIPFKDELTRTPHHIYLTSDEEIKEGDCFISGNCNYINIRLDITPTSLIKIGRKIIATTNLDLNTYKKITTIGSVPFILKEDLPKIVEVLNNNEDKVNCEQELWNAGHKTEHYRPKLNDDGSIMLIWSKYWYKEKIEKGREKFREEINKFVPKNLPEEKLYTREEIESIIDDFHSRFCTRTGTEDLKEQFKKERL